MRSDPQALVLALQQFYSLLESDVTRGRESRDAKARRYWNAINSIHYEGMMLKETWLVARRSKDDQSKMERYLEESMESLAKIEQVVTGALADVATVEIAASLSDVRSAMQSVLDEVASYRAVIETDFRVELPVER